MTRNRAAVDELDAGVTAALLVLRSKLYLPDGSEQELALSSIETFCAVAIQVFRKTNPSKLRSEARTLEIRCRLDGIPVVRGAA